MPESSNKTLKVTEQIQWRVESGVGPAVVNSEPTSLFIVSSCLSKPREILLSVLFGGRSVCCRRYCQMKSRDARSTPSDTLHLHELQRDKQQLHRCAREIHRQPLALGVKSVSAWKLFEGDSDQCWHSLKRQWQKQQKPQPTEDSTSYQSDGSVEDIEIPSQIVQSVQSKTMTVLNILSPNITLHFLPSSPIVWLVPSFFI